MALSVGRYHTVSGRINKGTFLDETVRQSLTTPVTEFFYEYPAHDSIWDTHTNL